MDPKTQRIALLRRWRERAEAVGHRVPSDLDVTRIAAADDPYPPHVDRAAVIPWEATIRFLLDQLRMGVHDPVEQLPTKLQRPDADEQVLAALRRWRSGAMSDNQVLSGLKDSMLRTIVRSSDHSEAAVRRHLPPSLKAFAGAIARVMAEVLGPAARTDPPPPGARAGERTGPGTSGAAADPDGPTIDLGRTDNGRHRRQPEGPAETPAGARRDHPPTGSDTDADGPADRLDDELNLADYAYGVSEGEPGPLAIRPRAIGLELSWDHFPDRSGTTLYRLVSSDDGYPPYAPQVAELVAVSNEPAWTDRRPFGGAVRYLQVWAHHGQTREAAAATEPVLHAEGFVVAPVQEVDIGHDEGRVVGRWTAPKGTRAVQIRRVPVEFARRDAGNPRWRILADEENLGGFEDDSAERDRRYLYQVFAEAVVDGTRILSAPVTVEVRIPPELVGVTDLDIVLHGDRPAFDLSWIAPPHGVVRIYRTAEPPAPSADAEPMAEDALGQAGLPDTTELRQQTGAIGGGRTGMLRVPWPRDWMRAYFTPVTLLDGNARIGRTINATRTAPIIDPVVVERVHRQVLTFGWPDGASRIFAYVGRPGQNAESAVAGQPEEITAEKYRKQGGLYFSRSLPAGGCSVHLVPVAYSAGELIHGPVATVGYLGLTRLGYTLTFARDRKGHPVEVTAQIFAELDDPQPIPFTLIHNEQRLPLEIHDGKTVPMTAAGDPGAESGPRFVPSALRTDPGSAVWRAPVQGRRGYLRLFACVEPERMATVALVDPPIADMRLADVPPARRWGR